MYFFVFFIFSYDEEETEVLNSDSQSNKIFDSDQNNENEINNYYEENNDDKNEEIKTSFIVGEIYQDRYLKIQFVNLNENFIDYYRFFSPKDGYKVVKSSFSFENIGNSDKLVSSYNFNCYADGVAYDQFYSVDDSAFSHTLSSGKKASGDVYCEVPINSTSITLEYDTNFWTSENIEFVIK